MTLTVDRARELLDYDPETGAFSWRVRRSWNSERGANAGRVDSQGYVRIKVDSRSYKAHRLALLITYGYWPSDQVDHINRVKSDNRIANLREATRSLNMQNQKKAMSNNTSGLLGVHWYKHNGKFGAHIKAKGALLYLGLYPTPEEAHDAYITAKRQLHAGCTI